jgi:hypothetical protein
MKNATTCLGPTLQCLTDLVLTDLVVTDLPNALEANRANSRNEPALFRKAEQLLADHPNSQTTSQKDNRRYYS